jgi:hypothetical protein
VAELRRQVSAYGTWMNTDQYSSPVYTVPANQPTVRVTLDQPAGVLPDLRAAWDQVPIPPDAQPAAGTDHTLVVWQPSTNTMWEFWVMNKQADGWHAAYGGRMLNVSSNPGYFTDPPSWGATATSLPFLGGLVRIDELRAGRIDHALALAIPQARAGWYSWPAQRTDGNLNSSAAIPEGTRFRLDPHLNIAALGLPPLTRMLAEAAQRYGIVVRDQGGCVAFYGEDPTPLGTNPYAGPDGFYQGDWVNHLLAQFPWAQLQTLKTDLRSS